VKRKLVMENVEREKSDVDWYDNPKSKPNENGTFMDFAVS